MKKILLLSVLLTCLVLGGVKLFFYACDKSNFCHFSNCGFEFIGKYKYFNKALEFDANVLKLSNQSNEKSGKYLGYYKYEFGHGYNGFIEIMAFQHNDSQFPSTARGKSFLEGSKKEFMKSATMVSDISEYDDSLVVKYIEQIPHYVDVPYKYWVKSYNVKDRYYDYNEGGFKWGYVKKGGYYTTRYKSVRKEFPSSSSIIYKNGIAYFITIVSFYNEYTSVELYDMIIPCLRLVNVKMKQLQLYALTFFILIFAIVVILIMHRYIKKYIHEQNGKEYNISYNIVVSKIIWPYFIVCVSVFTCINVMQLQMLDSYKFGYIIMYIFLFLYYINIIIKNKDFGIKQILFCDILLKTNVIKKEWNEIKVRKYIFYIGIFMLTLFYIIPCAGFIKIFDMNYNVRGYLLPICLIVFYIIMLYIVAKTWIYSPQKRIENNGEDK